MECLMNIREIADFSPNYCDINREERNYSAILFAALCNKENSKRFLSHCGFSDEIGKDFGIYFEYAYLRDLWSHLDKVETKKNIIRKKLRIKGIDDILGRPLKEINQTFGVGGKPSSAHLQFPGKWAITKYNRNFPDNEDFLKICKFKWSFNIKPDIVIHINKNYAICIEAKYISGEGSYPNSNLEKSIFKKERGLAYVRQMELQKYMMEDLLGIRTDFMFLVSKKEKSETHKVIHWAEAFDSIDMSAMPAFALNMAANISKYSG